MCGIAGFLDLSGRLSKDATRSVVTRMTRQLAHRGPDDEGVWTDPATGMALGHRRLAILDLSPLGHQPMLSQTGRYVLALNGEVYNFAGLRAELQSDGSAPDFRGGSDTEVLLACVERWGLEASLRRFNGMFALALWDRQERRLYLARDRLGEKPLYYGWAGTAFLFASELKAFRAHPQFPAEIDRGVLPLYFRHNYIPGPHSIYRGVCKLPPGGWLEMGTATPGAEPVVRTYWSAREIVQQGTEAPFRGTGQEAITELQTRLLRTVSSRMIADVPLGAFLSGGIDSSLIVALMQAASTRPVKTFTAAFEDPAYNEAHHARAVARHLRTDHTELPVTPSDAIALIPRLADVYDEPFADASQIPTMLICALARRFVTVALTGDGGDESFGGYARYFWHASLWRLLVRLPGPAKRALSLLLNHVPAGLPAWFRQRNPRENLHRLQTIVRNGHPETIYQELISIWPDPWKLVRDCPGARPASLDPPAWTSGVDPILQLMLLDTTGYLPDDILVKLDRASMHVALEARAPLLDHEIFQFAAALPMSIKVGGRPGKRALRQVLYKYVPKRLVDRPKAGFAVPLDDWLRGRLRPWAEDLLHPARLAAEGFLDPATVERKWTEHLSGRCNWMYPLWGILMFQSWLSGQRTLREPTHEPALGTRA